MRGAGSLPAVRRAARDSLLGVWFTEPDIGATVVANRGGGYPRRLIAGCKAAGVGCTATVMVPKRLKHVELVCPVDTGAPCDPATPTDNAIRDQRG